MGAVRKGAGCMGSSVWSGLAEALWSGRSSGHTARKSLEYAMHPELLVMSRLAKRDIEIRSFGTAIRSACSGDPASRGPK
jgi:hypothetical protein